MLYRLLEWDACTEHLIKLNRYLFSKKYEEGRISVYLNKDNELTFRVEVNPSGKSFESLSARFVIVHRLEFYVRK